MYNIFVPVLWEPINISMENKLYKVNGVFSYYIYSSRPFPLGKAETSGE